MLTKSYYPSDKYHFKTTIAILALSSYAILMFFNKLFSTTKHKQFET